MKYHNYNIKRIITEEYIMFPLEMKNRLRHIKWKNKEKPFDKANDEYNYYICDLYEIKD